MKGYARSIKLATIRLPSTPSTDTFGVGLEGSTEPVCWVAGSDGDWSAVAESTSEPHWEQNASSGVTCTPQDEQYGIYSTDK